VPELVDSLPVILRAVMRRKVTPAGAMLHPHKAPKEVKRIFELFDDQDERSERNELNIYVTGVEDEDVEKAAGEEERGPHE
jgi:succinate dehydrogenase / fumarate reductase iron-sulfur subunit